MDLPLILVLRLRELVCVCTPHPPALSFANCSKIQDIQGRILSGSDLKPKLHWLVVKKMGFWIQLLIQIPLLISCLTMMSLFSHQSGGNNAEDYCRN